MGYKLIFSIITPYLPLFFKGLQLSIIVSVVGMAAGSLLGILAAVGKSSPVKVIQKGINIYIEIFRNTPLLIQMYLLYFGLAQFDIHIPAVFSAILAMTLNVGAYTAVIFHAGIKAVFIGQSEAARALGMTGYQTFCHIVFPQAFRIVIPPLTNQFISVFLFSSVAAAISVNELSYVTLNVESVTMRTFEAFIITAALYLTVTTIISILSGLYERSFKY
jgi:polar amino acid transport system permease protein